MREVTEHLDIVYRMMSAFASNSDINQTLYQGLDFIREKIGAEAASFFYLQPAKNTLLCAACIGPIDITGLEVPATQGIVGAVTQSDEMRFVPDVSADSDFSDVVDTKTGFETRSMICVPVSGNGKKFGALQVLNRLDGKLFSKNDAALISVYGKSAALALDNSQLAARMVEANSIKRDLKMASKVQESLFPKTQFDFIHGVNVPKKGVSGDLYDYVERDGEIYFCMADVSGKGTDAALVMAKTHSLFRSLSRSLPDPAELAAKMNRELVETAFNGMFVTAIIGLFDPNTGDMSCCNAGHEPGLVVQTNGAFRYIQASLQPLGVLDFDTADIVTETSSLNEARFFCYSDGITEAVIDGQMIGPSKLAHMLAEQMDLTVKLQIENTVSIVRNRVKTLPDDLTILGLGCAPHINNTSHIEKTVIKSALVGENLLFNISLVNEVPELRRLRREMENMLVDTQARHKVKAICHIVDEAVQNIIRHAFPDNMSGQINVSGYILGQKLNISLTDTAPLIDLELVKPRDLADVREGGLGTHFIREIAEEAHWLHDNNQNRLDLVFAL